MQVANLGFFTIYIQVNELASSFDQEFSLIRKRITLLERFELFQSRSSEHRNKSKQAHVSWENVVHLNKRDLTNRVKAIDC